MKIERVLPEATFYVGPMGAGKTTRLRGKMGELEHLGKPYAAFRPGVDVRDHTILPKNYANGEDILTEPNCATVDSLDAIPVEELVAEDIRTIMLEETFMFGFDRKREPIPELYLRTMARWAISGVEKVYAAGLDRAANGNEFGLVADARRYGAKIVTLTAKCGYPANGDDSPRCGEAARNSQIFDGRDSLVFDMHSLPDLLPEGEWSHLKYRAVCPLHLLLDDKKIKLFETENVQELVTAEA